jgi:metal-responsive CopG/Arc/MetJ family transcriptional regulator
MRKMMPEEGKKIKISVSIDPFLDKEIEEILIEKKFYKKSRLVEFLLRKYIEDNKKETH